MAAWKRLVMFISYPMCQAIHNSLFYVDLKIQLQKSVFYVLLSP